MDPLTKPLASCLRCRKIRHVRVLPTHCSCGNVIRNLLAPAPLQHGISYFYLPTLPQKSHAEICRTNECGYYKHEQCMKQVQREAAKGNNVAGWVSYLDHHPEVRCPKDDPMWYVGKVGFLSVSYMKIGGTETFHRTLVPNIKNVAGFVTLNTDLAEGDANLLGCPYGVGHAAAKRLARDVDLLIVWGVGSDLNKILPSLERKPRVISISHCNQYNGWTKQFMMEQEPWTDHFVYINPDGLGTVPMSRRQDSTMIPNGINEKNLVTTHTREAIRAKYNIPDDATLGVMLTRLSPEKGVQQAMECVAKTNHYFLVAGNASYWNKEYRRKLETLQTKRIKLIEPVAPTELLPAADYYLSLSEYEGFGLSMAEAMAMGVPVVATRTGLAGTHPDAFTLVPTQFKASQVVEAITNRLDTAAVAKEIVLSKYNLQTFVNNWQTLINEQAKLPTQSRWGMRDSKYHCPSASPS